MKYVAFLVTPTVPQRRGYLHKWRNQVEVHHHLEYETCGKCVDFENPRGPELMLFDNPGQIIDIAQLTGQDLHWTSYNESGVIGELIGCAYSNRVPVIEPYVQEVRDYAKFSDIPFDAYRTTATFAQTAVSRDAEFDVFETLDTLQRYTENMTDMEAADFTDCLFNIVEGGATISGWDLHESDFFLYYNTRSGLSFSIHVRVFNMLTDEEINNIINASI